MNSKPFVTSATVRDGGDEWHIECRMADGQKYAAITVDKEAEGLADAIADFLNGGALPAPVEPKELAETVERLENAEYTISLDGSRDETVQLWADIDALLRHARAPRLNEDLAEAVRQLDVFVEGLDGCTHFQAGEIVATALQKHLRTLLARARAPRLSDAQMEAVEWFVEVQDRLLLHHLRWQAIVHEGVNAAMRHPGCEKTLAAGCADRRRRWQNANYELWASCDAARAAFAAELGEVDRG